MNNREARFQTKLMDDDTQLIVKHFVVDGSLNLNDPSVQVAFFSITGVKEALLAEANRREEEAKSNCK